MRYLKDFNPLKTHIKYKKKTFFFHTWHFIFKLLICFFFDGVDHDITVLLLALPRQYPSLIHCRWNKISSSIRIDETAISDRNSSIRL